MMEAGEDGRERSGKLPDFGGTPGTWKEWHRRALAWQQSTTTADEKQAAHVLNCLRGKAWDTVEHLSLDPADATGNCGAWGSE